MEREMTSRCSWLGAAVLAALGGCAASAPAAQSPTAAVAENAVGPTPQSPPTAAEAPAPPQPSAALTGISPALLVKDGFAAPESVLYDIEADVYLVSNVNGTPFAVDDNGFISRVSPDGQVLALKWIDGADPKLRLHAPKGMAISAGVLYVADLDRLHKFDSQTGAALGDIVVPGASFVNDVTSGPDGTIYFTDTGIRQGPKGSFERTGTDAVYRLDKNHPVALARGKQLNQPNGVMADAAGVWIVTLGGKELYEIKKGVKARVQQLPGGILDGIIRTSAGQLYVSSWETNRIFSGEPGGEFSSAFEVSTPADIGYDVKRNRLLVPLMLEDSLKFLPL